MSESGSYNPTVVDHYEHPRNMGRLEAADGVGRSSGDCDRITIFLRVRDDCVAEIAFQCEGCPAARAVASMTTVLAKGKHLDDAAEIAADTIATALGGLPADQRHAAGLGAEALTNAIWDYVARRVEAESSGI